MNNKILQISAIHKSFGAIVALDNLSLELEEAQTVGIIGPNGTGKTSLLDCISGLRSPDQGTIYFDHQNLGHKQAHQIYHLGITRTFKYPRLFPQLTVQEHLLISRKVRLRDYLKRSYRSRTRAWIQQCASEFSLHGLLDQQAAKLTLEDQMRLEFACAVIPQPKLLLLDEIFMLHPDTDWLIAYLQHLKKDYRTAILIVEKNLQLVQRLCERVLIMNSGRVIADGKPDEILQDDIILKAFFTI